MAGMLRSLRTDAASLSHPSSQTWQPKASRHMLQPNAPFPLQRQPTLPSPPYRPMTNTMGVRSSAPPMA